MSIIGGKSTGKSILLHNLANSIDPSQVKEKEDKSSSITKNIEKEFCKIVKLMCDEAIMEELNIHPKFGLVTPYTNGSHQDMNYDIMIKAKNAILDSFVEMFKVGFTNDDLNKIFKESRMIGIDAEI